MSSKIQFSDFQQYDNLELLARQVVEGFITGLHKSPFHGFSVEFAEHRLYNKGESIKHIDWKLYARSEKMFVKRYEEETNLRSHIFIDTSSSMLYPYKDKKAISKLNFSIASAAALIYLLRKQRDAVGLTLFSDKLELHTPSKLSLTHAKLLYSHLENKMQTANQQLNKRTAVSRLLHGLAENIYQRSLIIIFSDMMDSEKQDDIFSALQHLRYNKHEVILFHVSDKNHEQDFNFNNNPYQFVDMESGENIKINPNEIRASYTEEYKKFFNEIKLKCGQFKIDFVEADINSDLNNVLLSYLIKRNKLY